MKGIVLRAGNYEATFRPDIAMICTSLRFRGNDFVAWPRTLAQFKTGKATAIPLMHPWGNRLHRWGYEAAGKRVNLRGLPLPTDPNGSPIHGNCFGAHFDVTRVEDARVTAQLNYEHQRAFPFPHVVTVDARVHPARGLTITTEVRPTTNQAVPISFCWHPYVKLPAGGRARWKLRWPACEHMYLDRHLIPTGARTAQPREFEPIANRTFDDHYALGRDRTFAISNDVHDLTLHFDAAYPFAQLFVPPRRQLVAIEPMTAEIDALNRGTAPVVQPRDRFRASFRVTCDTHVS